MTEFANIEPLVAERSLTTGTLDLTTTQKWPFRRLSAYGIGVANKFFYCAYLDSDTKTEWECGLSHLAAEGLLVRADDDAIQASSNGGNRVNFSAGTKIVTSDIPAHIVNILWARSQIGLAPAAVPPSWMFGSGAFGDVKYLDGGDFWNPPSIAAGGAAFRNIAVPGVALGDLVIGAGADIDAGGLVLTGEVTAADNVSLTLANHLATPIDLGSANFYVRVMLRNPLR